MSQDPAESEVTEPSTEPTVADTPVPSVSAETTEASQAEQPIASELSRDPQLAAIVARLEANYRACLGLQREAVTLRRQCRLLLASLETLPSEADRVRARAEADNLMQRACAAEEKMPGLFEGIGRMMVDQTKLLADQDE